jgi:hypothetical protein
MKPSGRGKSLVIDTEKKRRRKIEASNPIKDICVCDAVNEFFLEIHFGLIQYEPHID